MSIIDGGFYYYWILFYFFYFSTILLVLARKSWGHIPIVFVRNIGKLLEFDNSDETFEDVNNNSNRLIGKCHLTVGYLENEKYKNPFEISTDLMSVGMQSILQDDLSRPFSIKSNKFSLQDTIQNWNIHNIIYAIGFLIRWFFIFPLRVCFLATSFVFLPVSSLICVLFNANQEYFRYCGITFARLFNISTGLIVTSFDKKNKPRVPGLAVANHLSANDVMTLYSDVDYEGKGYTITAQSHGGIVHYLEKYGGYLTPILLVNRACDSARNGLREAIIQHSRNLTKHSYPVLLFPEGYCSNNKAVLQFRKAIFDGHAPIYPIALHQNNRFGDAFWAENTYLPYLIRMMTSWCSIIDIHYLPPMSKEPTESDEQFAKRVQLAIAGKITVDALPYDGKLGKSEKERDKYRGKLQNCLVAKIENLYI